VPNVIDAAAFEDVRRFPLGSSGAAYVGVYSYAPNEEAAHWIITDLAPLFAGRDLGVIDLIGRLPTPRMVRLASPQEGVRVVGEVDDPWVAVRGTGALIVPLRTGAGTRWKVLEAAVSEVPIVSTGFGVQGLDLEPEIHYLPAESARQFADSVELLRTNPRRRQALVDAARAVVEAKYSRAAARTAMGAGIRALTASAPDPR
jgi:glycosyltransferase involved in cell wall biosynthesis